MHVVATTPSLSTPLAMQLLASGVPLSLLMDLVDPLGPDSLGILHNECAPRRVITLDPTVVDLTQSAGVAS